MSTNLLRVKNKQGMVALADACAITRHHKIAYLSLVSQSIVAVKAIWASVVGGHPIHIGYRSACGDDVKYITLRYNSAGIHRWVMFPDRTAPYLLLIPLSQGDEAQILVRLLRTIWPVRAEWGDILLKRGKEAELVVKCDVYGIPWAYTVNTLGWDGVIDAAAKAGELVFGGAQ